MTGVVVRRRLLGVLGVFIVAGCASGTQHQSSTSPSVSQASPSPTVSVTVSTSGESVSLTKGQTLQVVLPAAARQPDESTTYGLLPADTPVLVPVAGTADLFRAAADGTAQVTVTQTPMCSPGDECPAHIVNLGTVDVAVTG